MKLPTISSLAPALSALALLATAGSSWADHKVTVYSDRDGDGHYNKKKVEVPHHNYYHSGPRYYSHSPYYRRPYSGYGYGYGPSVNLTYQRSYSPSYRSSNYSDGLAVDVQRELRRRGYYRGSIDGDIGPGTRSAIRAYQYDRGLATTGRIDTSLLRSLGIG